jgi:hypothetical protein
MKVLIWSVSDEMLWLKANSMISFEVFRLVFSSILHVVLEKAARGMC